MLMRPVCGLFLLLLIASCAHRGSPEAHTQDAAHVHVVAVPGETLSHLALWYSGSVHNWKRLEEANPELDPRRMVVGTNVRIPQSLLQRSDAPPPRFFRSKVKSKDARTLSAPKEAAVAADSSEASKAMPDASRSVISQEDLDAEFNGAKEDQHSEEDQVREELLEELISDIEPR